MCRPMQSAGIKRAQRKRGLAARMPRLRAVAFVLLACFSLPYRADAALRLRPAGLDRDAVALADRRSGSSASTCRSRASRRRCARGDRRRGRPLLQPSRRRLGRNARGLGRSRRSRRAARRLDHHPAGREEPVPVAGPQLSAQGAGIAAGAVDRPGAVASAASWRFISTSPNGARTANSASRPAAATPSASRRASCRAYAGGAAGGRAAQSARARRAPSRARACGGWPGSTSARAPRARRKPPNACARPTSLGRTHPL